MGRMDAPYCTRDDERCSAVRCTWSLTCRRAAWVAGAGPLPKLFQHHLFPYTGEHPAHACNEPLTSVLSCIQVRGLTLYQILPGPCSAVQCGAASCIPEPNLNLDLGWNLNLAHPVPTLPVTCLIVHIESFYTRLHSILLLADVLRSIIRFPP